ncbi:MAG TPA: diguanylate cyclase, partial [Chthonomonadaceae bacterium]|nr:diguanylate cyclase [Chthonomonadaceae bacterium]
LLPYAFLPAVGALLLFTGHVHGDEDRETGVFLGATALIGIVLLRQVFALLENGRLYRQLQETYGALEARNREITAYAEQTEQLNAELMAIQAELLANNQALSEANARLEALATTDSMTGLPNHRAFQERLRAEWAQARRHARPLALLFMDVDDFKQYNDAFGHPAGDEVLRQVAQLLCANVRAGDFVARYGGEEFAALLPQTDADAALAVAERIRAAVAIHAFPHRAMTLSIGMACQTGDLTDMEALVISADQALYAAKRLGRNRVGLTSDFTAELAQEPLPASALWRRHGTGAKSEREIGWGNIEGLLQEAAGQVLAGLLDALDLREAESEGHSQRVVRFALRLAWEADTLGLIALTPADIRELAFGALLHDIGKIGVPDHILLKSGPLIAEELIEMRSHLERGIALIQRFPLLAHALPVVQYHHERWDGTGYPYGLAGEAIPLTARLFAIVDAFEAMSCDRPYRAKRPYAVIRAEIERQAGAQFDPNLVTAFRNIPKSEWKRLARPDRAEPRLFTADTRTLPRAA